MLILRFVRHESEIERIGSRKYGIHTYIYVMFSHKMCWFWLYYTCKMVIADQSFTPCPDSKWLTDRRDCHWLTDDTTCVTGLFPKRTSKSIYSIWLFVDSENVVVSIGHAVNNDYMILPVTRAGNVKLAFYRLALTSLNNAGKKCLVGVHAK